MFNAEDRMRQATDVSLLNQLVLEVYLAAWTTAGVKDPQTLRRVAASSDDVDDGETAVDVVDLHRIRSTWGLDFGVPGGEIAERGCLPTRRGRARLLRTEPAACPRNDRTCLSGSLRGARAGSVCYTAGPYLSDQTGDHSRGGSCVTF